MYASKQGTPQFLVGTSDRAEVCTSTYPYVPLGPLRIHP